MPVESMERILDVAVKDSYKADCGVLHYGPAYEEIKIMAHPAFRGVGVTSSSISAPSNALPRFRTL